MPLVEIGGRMTTALTPEVLIEDLHQFDTLNDSAYEALRDFVSELRQKANYTAMKINTDLIAYESTFDEHNAAFKEVSECLQSALLLLQEKRVNRSKLTEILSHCIREIDECY